MDITVIGAGRLKESYWRDSTAEYAKRLGRYCRLNIIEVEDEKTPDGASPAQEEQIRIREGRRILKNIRDDQYVVALAIKGKRMSSEQFADRINSLALHGSSSLVFVIGGSLGLSGEVLARAREQISFSDMTFPHQLMRVILLEQIYRGFRILRHEPYHK